MKFFIQVYRGGKWQLLEDSLVLQVLGRHPLDQNPITEQDIDQAIVRLQSLDPDVEVQKTTSLTPGIDMFASRVAVWKGLFDQK